MRPTLYCLNGSLKGCTLQPIKEPVVIGSDPACEVRIPPSKDRPVEPKHARIALKGKEFIIESLSDQPIMINEEPVRQAILVENDLIRLGTNGPVFRFRPSESARVTKSFKQMMLDVRDVGTHTDGERPPRFTSFARQFIKEAVAHSTKKFRLLVTVLVIAVVVLGAMLINLTLTQNPNSDAQNRKLEAELADSRRELAELNAAIASIGESIKKRQSESEQVMEAITSRLTKTERTAEESLRVTAAARTIHERYHKGICFLAIGTTFYNPSQNKFVRYQLDPKTGERVEDADGYSVILGGEGTKYFEWCFGTGFVVSKEGHVVSNRHVVDPWYKDDEFGHGLMALGCRPLREIFIACFPGIPDPIEVTRVGHSPDRDLAVAVLGRMPDTIPTLPIANEGHSDSSGDRVVLIGYPLGLEGLLTKMDDDAASRLKQSGVTAFEPALREITKLNNLRATMTEGVLSNVTLDQIVYGARTISGGSGGPVFASDGNVIGVNTAITRFDGASLGVPVAFLRPLLKDLGKARAFDEVELPPDVITERVVEPPKAEDEK